MLKKIEVVVHLVTVIHNAHNLYTICELTTITYSLYATLFSKRSLIVGRDCNNNNNCNNYWL